MDKVITEVIERKEKILKISIGVKEATPKSGAFADNFSIETFVTKEFDAGLTKANEKKAITEMAKLGVSAHRQATDEFKGTPDTKDYVSKSEIEEKYILKEEARKKTLEFAQSEVKKALANEKEPSGAVEEAKKLLNSI